MVKKNSDSIRIYSEKEVYLRLLSPSFPLSGTKIAFLCMFPEVMSVTSDICLYNPHFFRKLKLVYYKHILPFLHSIN